MYKLYYKIKYFLINLVDFPFKLFKWSKIIFWDQDYDPSFLLNVIEFKLKSMRKYFEKCEYLAKKDQQNILRRIKLVLAYIQHYNNFYDYREPFFKIKEPKYNFLEDDSSIETIDGETIKLKKLVKEGLTEREHRIYAKRIKSEFNDREEIYKKIFEIIGKYSEGWFF